MDNNTRGLQVQNPEHLKISTRLAGVTVPDYGSCAPFTTFRASSVKSPRGELFPLRSHTMLLDKTG